jgi:preprotein translocase subunit YajC
MIRPQRKQQKELQEFRNSLKKGDKVVTIGGIYGTVAEIKAESTTVLIEVDNNVKIRVDKNSLVKDFTPVQ